MSTILGQSSKRSQTMYFFEFAKLQVHAEASLSTSPCSLASLDAVMSKGCAPLHETMSYNFQLRTGLALTTCTDLLDVLQLIRTALLSHRILFCGDFDATLLLCPISQGSTHTHTHG